MVALIHPNKMMMALIHPMRMKLLIHPKLMLLIHPMRMVRRLLKMHQTRLNAPTLLLGEASQESISDSDQGSEDFQSTEVSSGWLGKCYTTCNKADKKEKAKAELQQCLREVEQHVKEHDLITPSMMDSYLANCRGTLQSCLLSAFCTLLGESHILSCVHQQKADQDLWKSPTSWYKHIPLFMFLMKGFGPSKTSRPKLCPCRMVRLHRLQQRHRILQGKVNQLFATVCSFFVWGWDGMF